MDLVEARPEGIARVTTCASSVVNRYGRAFTMARAIRREWRSSPKLKKMSASSRSLGVVHQIGGRGFGTGINSHV